MGQKSLCRVRGNQYVRMSRPGRCAIYNSMFSNCGITGKQDYVAKEPKVQHNPMIDALYVYFDVSLELCTYISASGVKRTYKKSSFVDSD
jgi:hypothetical protein